MVNEGVKGGTAGMRAQRERMLREAMTKKGERATGETARYYMEVREGREANR